MNTQIPNEERDPEAVIMDETMHYMNRASDRAKKRLMLHLMHKYYPNGDVVFEITAPVRLTPPSDAPRMPSSLPPMPREMPVTMDPPK